MKRSDYDYVLDYKSELPKKRPCKLIRLLPYEILQSSFKFLNPVELQIVSTTCSGISSIIEHDGLWRPFLKTYLFVDMGTPLLVTDNSNEVKDAKQEVLRRVRELLELPAESINAIGLECVSKKYRLAATECFRIAYEKSRSLDDKFERGHIAYCFASFLHMVRGDFMMAAKLYDEAISDCPDSCQVLAAAASLYTAHRVDTQRSIYLQPQPKKSIKLYERAIDAMEKTDFDSPNRGRIYSGLGYALLLNGDYVQSVHWFENSISRGDPAHFNVIDLLSYALLLQRCADRPGNHSVYDQTDMLYRICLMMAPDSLIPNILYASYLYTSKKDRQTALQYFDKVIDLDSGFQECCNKLQNFCDTKEKPLAQVSLVVTKGREPGCRISFLSPTRRKFATVESSIPNIATHGGELISHSVE